MNILGQDLGYAVRLLRKNPGFTAVAMLTLAITIGANTAIFSIVDAVLLKPLPYPRPEEIVMLWERSPKNIRYKYISPSNFLAWKSENTVFDYLSGARPYTVTWTGSGEPQQLSVQFVSVSYFKLFGVQAALGRTFASREEQGGNEQVAVLTHRLWQSRFGGDSGILGRILTLDGKPYTVVGVLPPGAFDRARWELYLPLAFTPDRLLNPQFALFQVFGRLKNGVAIEKARAEMETIAANLARTNPETNQNRGVTVDRFVDRVVSDQLRLSLMVLVAAVGAVLLIGCANLTNLMLARNAMRAREVAIRSALGATRRRLIRQTLTESVLVSWLGGVVGIGLGYGAMRGIQIAMPAHLLPEQAAIQMDWRVLLFSVAVTMLTGVLCGTAPAFRSSRWDSGDALSDGARGSSPGMARHHLRNALVAAEVALAFVLLTGAGVLMRSLVRLLNVDPGFEATNIITMGLPRTMGQDSDGERLNSYYRSILQHVAGLPGVREAALTSALPLQGWYGMPFRLSGGGNLLACGFKIVSPSYFSALGIRLRRGRTLSDWDVAGSPPVTVLNETMVHRFFPGEDPIGKQILIQQIIPSKLGPGPWIRWQVVGVVADEKTNGLDADSAGIYVPLPQSPVVGLDLLIRTAIDPHSMIRNVQSAVWSINREQALPDVLTLEQIVAESVGSNRLRTILLSIFAAIALGLAAVGVYGVVSYAVAQRTHEIGIRAALGAGPGDLIRLVVVHGMAIAIAGLALGAFGAIALTRFLANLLFRTSPTDLGTMLTVAGILGAAALLACFIPALRAARVDPITALRSE